MPCGPGPHGLREWEVITVPEEQMGFLQNKSARYAIWWECGNVAPDVPDHLSEPGSVSSLAQNHCSFCS